ncbi:MAG: hydroxymethylglutaryl-CoA lyase [Deferrisomatales bacterium]
MIATLRKVLSTLPTRATVVDVSARDGLQAVSPTLPSAVRAAWVARLLGAGVPEVEAGSFVSTARVPQMADTAGVLERLRPFADRLWVLVANQRGLEDALEAGARNLVCVLSATETHSLANLGRPVEGVLAELGPLARQARGAGTRTRAAVSMAWVDPEEGAVPRGRVVGLARELARLGFRELTLCDTYGGASPRDVTVLLEEIAPAFPLDRVGLHLHDTFGVASANVLAGLAAGVGRFDGAIGGLGGCPFAPGARGNVDTEHVVYLLHSLGVDTGIDGEALAQAAGECLAVLRKAQPGGGPDDRGPKTI